MPVCRDGLFEIALDIKRMAFKNELSFTQWDNGLLPHLSWLEGCGNLRAANDEVHYGI